MIYISTDSIYDGDAVSLHKETDNPNPKNYYSKTKLFGENSASQIKNSLILRTNILGWSSAGQNSFFEWILNNLNQKTSMNLFADVFFSPVHVLHLSEIINIFLTNSIGGVFNCGSSDCLSKYQFGIKVAEIFNLPKDKIVESKLENVDLKATRPKNMALCTDKLANTIKYKIPSTDDVIDLLHNEYKNSLNVQTL